MSGAYKGDALDLTPQQLFAYCDVIHRNRTARYIDLVQVINVGAQGDEKAVKAQVAAWLKDV